MYKSMRKVFDDERVGLFVSKACRSLNEVEIPVVFIIREQVMLLLDV